MENQHGWESSGGDVEIKCGAPTTIHSLTDRVHVWTSIALGSNNCILDVSKHGTPPVLCRAEPSHLVAKGRVQMCPGLWRPWVFLRHELIVYIITHFWSLSSPQQRNKQDAYQNHYSQVWKAVTFVRVTAVSLPCPTYWPILPGQVKYVPPAIACPFGRGIDGTHSRRRWW